MTVGIQFVGQVDGQCWIRVRGGLPLVGHWLAEYEPDALEGVGQCRFTENPAEAMRFDDVAAATACWEQQSSIEPYAKPLQTFSIHIAELP